MTEAAQRDSQQFDLKVRAVPERLILQKQQQINDAIALRATQQKYRQCGGRDLDDTSDDEADVEDIVADQLRLLTGEGDTRGRAANELWGRYESFSDDKATLN